jgi:hypothetical protein
MLAPGKIYPGDTKRIAVNFQNTDDDDTDPSTVTFKLRSPGGIETSYEYGTDAELVKSSTGDYYVDVTPDFDGYSDEFTPAYGGGWYR